MTLAGEERLTQHEMRVYVCVWGVGGGGGEPLGDRLSLAQVPGTVRSFDLFNAELSEERPPAGTETAKDGGRGGELGAGKGLSAYHTRDCHRQIDFLY